MVPSCAGFAPQAGADRVAARISPNSNLNHDCFINYFSFCLLDETEGLWAQHQGAFATRFGGAPHKLCLCGRIVLIKVEGERLGRSGLFPTLPANALLGELEVAALRAPPSAATQ